MPKVHNIGKQHFVQYIDFPVQWRHKVAVRGWTQEIVEPFRTTDDALIIRLPFHKALVFGKWTGYKDEETALISAVGMRVLADEDFEEGWTAPAYQAGAKSIEDWDV